MGFDVCDVDVSEVLYMGMIIVVCEYVGGVVFGVDFCVSMGVNVCEWFE